TEKLWGIPATSIQSDWAAQRIKNLSLSKAILNALSPRRKQTDVTSLIEEFQYPKYGPGMMWERCTEKAEKLGATVALNTAVIGIQREEDAGAVSVTVSDGDGVRTVPADHVISSMPLSQLVKIMQPPAPPEVVAAADDLRYRDFLTVALVVPEKFSFPDNWIYIHSPEVMVGRIQNFGSWSPYLVKDGRTCLGLEFFVNEGDNLWDAADEDLVALGTRELETLKLVKPGVVEIGYVVRMPKAYPVYDETYQRNVDIVREWLERAAPNVHPIGRNGMHRYNNQDHSMMTAMLTVENILAGTDHDIWAVNVEEEYHEEKSPGTGNHGTGRAAPILPRQRPAEERSTVAPLT
ncbi:MAG: FAD-dependent oxidoreductase, partial [Actinobacteria bacterium 13_2_20CM_2_71_6]